VKIKYLLMRYGYRLTDPTAVSINNY